MRVLIESPRASIPGKGIPIKETGNGDADNGRAPTLKKEVDDENDEDHRDDSAV